MCLLLAAIEIVLYRLARKTKARALVFKEQKKTHTQRYHSNQTTATAIININNNQLRIFGSKNIFAPNILRFTHPCWWWCKLRRFYGWWLCSSEVKLNLQKLGICSFSLLCRRLFTLRDRIACSKHCRENSFHVIPSQLYGPMLRFFFSKTANRQIRKISKQVSCICICLCMTLKAFEQE